MGAGHGDYKSRLLAATFVVIPAKPGIQLKDAESKLDSAYAGVTN